MTKILPTALYVFLAVVMTFGQDSLAGFELSGSVDVYYKYDLSGLETESGQGNIGTAFATDQNSVSIGMANLILSQNWDRVGFVADVAFGPRGQGQSLLNGSDGNSFHIQNLHVSWTPWERLTFTAGFMGTFIGYEVISPVSNFHYSTSYLFSGGPFQNAGVKATFAINDKIELMAGLFNDWNAYQDVNGMTDVGVQLGIHPTEGYDLYFNLLQSDLAGTTLDFVGSMAFTDNWTTGVNIAHHRNGETVTDYSGVALYQEWKLNDRLDLGIRGEWFKYFNTISEANPNETDGPRMFSLTASGHIHLGPLVLIPEWRIDLANRDIFEDGKGAPVGQASQVVVAAVYGF